MFKNGTFVFLLLVFLPTATFSQTYEIDYKIKVSKNRDSLNEVSDFTQAVFNEMDSLRMKLVFNTEKSIFKPPYRPGISKQKERIIKAARLFPIGLTHTYFYDLANQVCYKAKNFAYKDYMVKSEYSPPKWKLTDEEKIILNYPCHKAITVKKRVNRLGKVENITITAWYTNELPYPFGPKEYLGLPGVILELHESTEGLTRFSFLAEKVVQNPLGEVDFILPSEEEIINDEDFEKIVLDKNY